MSGLEVDGRIDTQSFSFVTLYQLSAMDPACMANRDKILYKLSLE